MTSFESETPQAFGLRTLIRIAEKRPLDDNEHSLGGIRWLRHEDDDGLPTLLDLAQNGNQEELFPCDGVLYQCTTRDVYEQGVEPDILESLHGNCNSVICVFGSTGTGRSALLEGEIGDTGLLEFSLHTIFNFVRENSSSGHGFQVRASFVQISDSNIMDLLNDSHEVTFENSKLIGLTSKSLKNPSQIDQVLASASFARSQDTEHVESTHTLLTFSLIETEKKSSASGEKMKTSVVSVRSIGFLCPHSTSGELAPGVGSLDHESLRECVADFLTGLSGSNVYNILEGSLNSACRTVVIASVSPDEDKGEILNTLNFMRPILPAPPSHESLLHYTVLSPDETVDNEPSYDPVENQSSYEQGNDQQATITQLQLDLEKAQQSNYSYEQHIDRLNNELLSKDDIIKQTRLEVNDLQSQLESATNERNDYMQRMHEYQNQVKRLEDKSSSLRLVENDLFSCRQKVQELMSEREQLLTECDSLRDECKQRAESHHQDNSLIEEERSRRAAIVTDLRRALERRSTERDLARQEMVSLRATETALNERVRQLEEELKHRDELLNQEHLEAQNTKTALDRSKAEIYELSSERETLRKQYNTIRVGLNTMSPAKTPMLRRSLISTPHGLSSSASGQELEKLKNMIREKGFQNMIPESESVSGAIPPSEFFALKEEKLKLQSELSDISRQLDLANELSENDGTARMNAEEDLIKVAAHRDTALREIENLEKQLGIASEAARRTSQERAAEEARLENELNMLADGHREATEKVDELTKKLVKSEEKGEQLDSVKRSLEEYAEKLEIDYDQYKQDVEVLLAQRDFELESMEKEHKDIEHQLETVVADAENDHKSALEMVQSLKKQLANSTAVADKLRKKMKDLQEQHDKCRQDLADSRDGTTINALRAELTTIRSNAQDMERLLNNKITELQDTTERRSTTDGEARQKLQFDLTKTAQDLQSAERELQTRRNEVEASRNALIAVREQARRDKLSLQEEFNAEMNRMRARRDHEASTMRDEHERELAHVRESAARDLSNLEESNSRELQRLRDSMEREIRKNKEEKDRVDRMFEATKNQGIVKEDAAVRNEHLIIQLTAELDETKKDLAAAAKAMTRNEAISSERSKLQHTCDQLQRQIGDLESGKEYARMKEKVSKLEKYETEHGRTAELSRNIADLKVSNKDLKARCEAAISEAQHLQGKLKELETLKALSAARDTELEKSYKTIDDFEKEINRIRKERDLSKTALEAERRELSSLRADLPAVQKENMENKIAAEASKHEIALLKENYRVEIERSESLRKDFYATQETLRKIEAQSKAHESELKSAVTERDHLATEKVIADKKANETEVELRETIVRAQENEIENRRLKEDRDVWKQQADIHKEAGDAWRKRATEVEGKLGSELQQTHAKLTQEREEFSHLSFEARSLRKQFQTADEELSKTKDELLAATAENKALGSNAIENKEALRNTKSISDALALEIKDLRERATLAESAKDGLQTELRSTLKELEGMSQNLAANEKERQLLANSLVRAEYQSPPRHVERSDWEGLLATKPSKADAQAAMAAGTPTRKTPLKKYAVPAPIDTSLIDAMGSVPSPKPPRNRPLAGTPRMGSNLSSNMLRRSVSRQSKASVAQEVLAAKEADLSIAEEENSELMQKVLAAEAEMSSLKATQARQKRKIKGALKLADNE